MSLLSLIIPSVGEKNVIAEPKVDTAFSKVEEWANGKVGTGNIEAGTVTETMLSAAVQTLLNTKSAFALNLVKNNTASVTIASGELIQMEKDAAEVKLPAATLNRIVGVYCATGGSAGVTIKAAVAKTIFGDFLSSAGETTITLTNNQHVVLEANGSSWLITAGEPLNENVYSAPTARAKETGIEPSVTRPTSVVLQIVGGTASITCGSLALLAVPAGSSVTLSVPAKGTWAWSGGATEVKESKRIL